LNVIVLALVQVPELADSVWPASADVPVIFGTAVFTGTASLAAFEKLATASTVTAAAQRSAKRFDLRVMRSPFSWEVPPLAFPVRMREL
jgi:hypothetical protein